VLIKDTAGSYIDELIINTWRKMMSQYEGNPMLEQTIFADPTSPAAWQAYGEWLRSQNDPRGELIAMESAGGSTQAEQIYAANKAEWAGSALAELMEQAKDNEEEGERCFSLVWEHGFIKSVRVQVEWDIDMPSPVEMLRTTLNSPAAQFIQCITIGVVDMEGENFYNQVNLAISECGTLNCMRELFIGDFDAEECEISWSEIGDVSKLYPVLPNLEKLKLRGGAIELGQLKHDKLKELIIETGGLSGSSVRSLAAADLPELVHAEIYFGDENYGAEGDISMIMPLLEAKVFPKVKYLGLENSEFEDDIAMSIATSPMLKQLDVLDLSQGTMTNKGAEAILANVDNFKHLQKLNLTENFIDKETQRLLEAALPGIVSLGEQKDAYEDDDEPWYYVSVGE
jgi:hypothetical protein